MVVWKIDEDPDREIDEFFLVIREDQVKDFDFVIYDEKIYLFYLSKNSSKINFKVLDKEMKIEQKSKGQGAFDVVLEEGISSLENIVCVLKNDNEGVAIVLNTSGIYLGNANLKFADFETGKIDRKLQITSKFEKFANLDGSRMELDDEYLVHRVFDYSPNGSQASFLNVYRLAHPKLHAQIPMDRQASVSNIVLLEQIKMGMEKSAIESAGNRHLQAHAPFFFRSDSKSGARILGAKADDSASAFYLYALHD